MVRARKSISVPQLTSRDREREPGGNSVKSARRVFEVLEFFEQLGRPATLSEVVQATGFPQSSTTMLLRTLQEMGYLCWNPDDRSYQPSLRLNMLGGWVHDRVLPRSNLRLAMLELSRRVGISVVLGQRNGRFVQYAHEAFATQSREEDLPIGTMRPLIETGLGHALMAVMPNDQVQRVISACLLDPHCHPAARSFDQIMAAVQTVRLLGYAYSTRLQVPGRASFAFTLNSAAHAETGQFGLAIAGRRSVLDERMPQIIPAINDVMRDFVPDVDVHIRATAPIEPL